MKVTTAMYNDDHDGGAHSRDSGVTRIESIEDLLRSRGFFDTAELDQKEEEVLVG